MIQENKITPAKEVIAPEKDENAYRFRVRVGGTVHKGWLTYELYPEQPKARTLLLLNGTRDLLNSSQRAEYDLLVDHIRSLRGGRTVRAKNLVNQLTKGSVQLTNVRVAVHKFGPVPVYVLPEHYNVELYEETVEVRIALYPFNEFLRYVNPTRDRSPAGETDVLMADAEFLRSLLNGTDRLFQRYLEDIGEYLHDIEHHLGLRGVFQAAKAVETELAESIGSKLKKAVPSADILRKCELGLTQHALHDVQCELFVSRTDTLLAARYARNYVLYFLNELYRHLGVAPRSDYYREQFRQIKREFDSRIGRGYADEAIRNRLDNLQLLYRALTLYAHENYDELARIRSDTHWTRRFVDFAKFVASLNSFANEFKVAPQIARIFISHHHEVPVTETIRKRVSDWLSSEFGGRVAVLFFKSGPGPVVSDSIKRLIWMSDSVGAVIPGKTAPISSNAPDKRFLWIALEAEHGLLLDKRLLFMVEDGTDLKAVLDEFSTMGTFLSPGAHLPIKERIENLVRSLRDRVHATFRVTKVAPDDEDLNLELRQALSTEAAATLRARHIELIAGFFGQFTDDVRITLARLQQLLPYPKERRKAWIVAHLRRHYKDEQAAERALRAAWEQSKQRALEIDSTHQALLGLVNRRYYTGRLRAILRQLQPRSSEDQLLQMERQVLDSILPDEHF